MLNNMYYPAMLDLRNRTCLVVGGGKVAARKLRKLVKCGAHVKVLSPELGEEITRLLTGKPYTGRKVEWIKDRYSKSYLEGVFMCFVCTDDAAVNRKAAADAAEAGVLVNAADDPGASSFVVPAVRREGSITVAVGCCDNPAASRYIADLLIKGLEPWIPEYVDFVSDIRKKCRGLIADSRARQAFMKRLFGDEFIGIARKDMAAARYEAYKLLEEYAKKAGD